MSEANGKVCCNCRHNIRTGEITNIQCHCDIEVFWMEYANVKCHLETFDMVEKIKESMYKLNTEGYLSDKQYDIIEKEINCIYEQHKKTIFDNTKGTNKNIPSCYLQNIPIKGC